MGFEEVNASPFAVVMLAGLAACAVTTTGIWLVSQYQTWVRDRAAYFMSFAAGVLLTVSLVHILPRSFGMSALAPTSLLVGFIGLYLANRLLHLSDYHEEQTSPSKAGTASLIPVLGIAFHSFLDGVIYSITFEVSLFTGALTALGTILHEFPEGIIIFVLLQRGGYGLRRSVLYAFLAAALTTPLGVLVSYPLLRQAPEAILGPLLGLSAGALIYVGATHLLPTVERENKPNTVLVLLAGVTIGFLIILSKEGSF